MKFLKRLTPVLAAAALSLAPVLSLTPVLSLSAAPASAAEPVPFETKAFEAAQQAGAPIVIDVFATWCPTCAAQMPIVEKLATSPEYASVAVFQVDFDSQKDVLRMLGAQRQSTLIAFKGTAETGRLVGDTDSAVIEDLFRSAVKD